MEDGEGEGDGAQCRWKSGLCPSKQTKHTSTQLLRLVALIEACQSTWSHFGPGRYVPRAVIQGDLVSLVC